MHWVVCKLSYDINSCEIVWNKIENYFVLINNIKVNRVSKDCCPSSNENLEFIIYIVERREEV